MGSSLNFDPIHRTEAPCRTPGSVYDTRFGSRTVLLMITLPVDLLADLTKREEELLARDFHVSILPAAERMFRDRWARVAGKLLEGDTVEMPASWYDL